MEFLLLKSVFTLIERENMINKLAIKISYMIIKKNKKYENQIDSLVLGLEIVISHLIVFGTILIVSIICDTLLETICFALVFCSIRSFSNGYHAKTFLECFMMTITVYLLCIYSNFYLNEHWFVVIDIANIALIFISLKKENIAHNSLATLFLVISTVLTKFKYTICTSILFSLITRKKESYTK